jgi:multidrug resistance efflux pump
MKNEPEPEPMTEKQRARIDKHNALAAAQANAQKKIDDATAELKKFEDELKDSQENEENEDSQESASTAHGKKTKPEDEHDDPSRRKK